jgi:dTDP-4-amino-4,6-dideoxygalactose transaminase
MSQARIPLVDLAAQYAAHGAEFDAAAADVVARSAFVGAGATRPFAEAFADWCGGGHVATCGNGTDALTLALVERLGPGDGEGEVITAAHGFIATAEAIVNAGYRPVFADVDPETCLLDVEALPGVIGEKTRAIVPVHLYGQMVAMDRLMAQAHGLAVIEDAAQAHGATWQGRGPGHWGDAACFSFYPGKNLGAWGDGGAVFTRDGDLAARIRARADHGRKDKYVHDIVGVNSRLDGLQAGVLLAKLGHLRDWNAARARAAALYDERIGARRVVVRPEAESVWHLYVVRVADRDGVRARLDAAGIGVGVHYPLPLHRQPAMAAFVDADMSLPESERAAAEVLSLPLFPEITPAQIDRVCEALDA